MCNRPTFHCSLTDRINYIIQKYEARSSICTPRTPARSICTPSCPPVVPIYTPRPVSACCPNFRSPRSYPPSSPSLCDIKCRKKPVNKCPNLRPICPGPNLKRYLSSKPVCPSLKGRLMLYEPCLPTPCTPRCPPSPTLSICRCKRGGPMMDYGNTLCPPIIRKIPTCSWKPTTYEPPFSSPVLEREFTSRFVKRFASELVLIDTNEKLAKEQAEDISHAGSCLGNPKIVGTKDYSAARDAAVCVIVAGGRHQGDQQSAELLQTNLTIFKTLIPNVCKFASSSVLVIVSSPVDILSYAAMKLSGFPPNRVLGLGTFLDTCRFQYFIAQKLGISPSSVQALIIGENSSTSVPVWSAVSVMGMKLKDINREIGSRMDPEGWNEIHDMVVKSTEELNEKKGSCKWGIGICVAEIVDAIVRNTCVCMTVSTFIKGCKHGLEKDVFMSLPCIIGRNGVQSYIRLLYTEEEQELTTKSCKSIYEVQKTILDQLE